jgi:hypothetical protein
MVGAVMLARATSGHALSDELLVAARERLMPAPGVPAAASPRRKSQGA